MFVESLHLDQSDLLSVSFTLVVGEAIFWDISCSPLDCEDVEESRLRGPRNGHRRRPAEVNEQVRVTSATTMSRIGLLGSGL